MNKNQLSDSTRCPLCLSENNFSNVTGPDLRKYFCCERCKLIFVHRDFLPAPEEEENRYRQHKNGIQYPDYVSFLEQAIEPTLSYINKNMKGLDFGCGPEPTLNKLLENKGFYCEAYDPIFFPKINLSGYSYIFATECFEHFHFPFKDIEKINKLLGPDGVLTIMTEVWSDKNLFADWYYAKDPTHVSFCHKNTFGFIANKYHYSIRYNENPRVTIMKKN